MFYINTQTLEYPITEGAIRTLYPNTSFPAQFQPPSPFAEVHDVPVPEYDRLRERVQDADPVLVDGVWQRQYEVLPLDPEVIAENEAAAQAQLVRQITDSTQARLDTFARTRNYDGILSACTYATSSVLTFQVEGQYCVAARDETWAKLYQIMNEVQAGTRPMPASYTDLEPELPVLAWPN